jgi:hypothetical protein
MPEKVASIAEGEPSTPTDGERLAAAPSSQPEEGASDNSASYGVFGLLVVVLMGGLIILRIRQGQ